MGSLTQFQRSVIIVKLIEGYIIPSMRYKIEIDPVETDPEINFSAKED